MNRGKQPATVEGDWASDSDEGSSPEVFTLGELPLESQQYREFVGELAMSAHLDTTATANAATRPEGTDVTTPDEMEEVQG